MSYCFFLVACWVCSCSFGGYVASSALCWKVCSLGAFLLMVTLLVWLLKKAGGLVLCGLSIAPSPSCFAPCRQDTTSPWSIDHGRNIKSQTLILMPAMEHIERNTRERERRRNKKNGKHGKREMKNMKAESPWPFQIPCPSIPKIEFHKRKSSFSQYEIFDYVFRFLRPVERLQKKRKRKI